MLDVTAALFAQRAIPRGDELFTHGQDLVTCLRAVAYRRRGLKPEPHTKRDLAKFAIGHGYEMEVADTLRAAGYDVLHDPKKFVVSAFGIDIIHPDIYLRDANHLVETKTSDGGANEPQKINNKPNPKAGQPKVVSSHHAIQVSLGAIAIAEEAGVDVPAATVLVKHSGVGDRGHEEVPHTVNPEQYRDIITILAKEVVDLTGPEMPLPPAEPKPEMIVPYDSCGYCRWRQCERNPQHVAKEAVA